jgi:hypothetical protein
MIHEDAIEILGIDNCIEKTIKDLTELSSYLEKFTTEKEFSGVQAAKTCVIEKLADVQISTRQMELIFGSETIRKVNLRKLKELREKIDKVKVLRQFSME